jgi:Xaa-Pro dipeptidase
MERRMNEPDLEPRLTAIMKQEYPRFSDAEYARRHNALGEVMAKAGVDHLLAVTDHRTGNVTQWVTGWPAIVEAYTIFKPGEKMTMYMEWYNHFPLAGKLARDVDVHWSEHRGIAKTIKELKRRGARTVGVMGPLVVSKWRQLEEHFRVVGLDPEYVRLRLIKSEEELDWLRIGAALSDLGLAALLHEARPGMTERELGNIVERAYVGWGGTTMIHYIGRTSMAKPEIFVPPQYHSTRRLEKGDVLFCELSAFWWDYAGQVLRTSTVGAAPTALYRDLYATAEQAFDAVAGVVRAGTTMEEIIDAAGVIENNGFTICDDLMHGFGGGYFPPILGTKSRPAGELPKMVLEKNMTVVIQPNVITRDRSAGVQVGELIRVTKTGFERLHSAERRLFRIC